MKVYSFFQTCKFTRNKTRFARIATTVFKSKVLLRLNNLWFLFRQ